MIGLSLIGILFVGCTQSETPAEATEPKQKEQVVKQRPIKTEERKEQMVEEEEVPQLNMNNPVKLITNLHDDKKIVSAVGVPVVDKEVSPAVDGSPAITHYWFSKDLTNNLELAFSKSYIEVYWTISTKDQKAALKVSQQAFDIGRILLGDENGKKLYNTLTSGDQFQTLNLGKHTVIDAHCGQFICRYKIKR